MSVEFKSEQLGSQTIKDKIGHAAVSRHQRKGLVLSLHTSQTDERCCLCTAVQGWAAWEYRAKSQVLELGSALSGFLSLPVVQTEKSTCGGWRRRKGTDLAEVLHSALEVQQYLLG